MDTEIRLFLIKLVLGGFVAFLAILIMSKTRAASWMFIVCGFLFSYISLMFDLFVSDSTVPWADSFTTALSIVGMWMLARKYIEQWWVWCIVDVASSALYVYKELYFTAALYAVYAIISIFGYYKWKKMMHNEQ